MNLTLEAAVNADRAVKRELALEGAFGTENGMDVVNVEITCEACVVTSENRHKYPPVGARGSAK